MGALDSLKRPSHLHTPPPEACPELEALSAVLKAQNGTMIDLTMSSDEEIEIEEVELKTASGDRAKIARLEKSTTITQGISFRESPLVVRRPSAQDSPIREKTIAKESPSNTINKIPTASSLKVSSSVPKSSLLREIAAQVAMQNLPSNGNTAANGSKPASASSSSSRQTPIPESSTLTVVNSQQPEPEKRGRGRPPKRKRIHLSPESEQESETPSLVLKTKEPAEPAKAPAPEPRQKEALVVVSQPTAPILSAGPVLTVRGVDAAVTARRPFIAPPPPVPLVAPKLKRRRTPPKQPADLTSISKHFLNTMRTSDRCPLVRAAALSQRHLNQLARLALPGKRKRADSREGSAAANASGHILLASPKKNTGLARSASLTVVARPKVKDKEPAPPPQRKKRRRESSSSSMGSSDSEPDFDIRWNEVDFQPEAQWHRAPSEDRDYEYSGSVKGKARAMRKGAPENAARNELLPARKPVLVRTIVDPFLATSTMAVLAPEKQVSLIVDESIGQANPIGNAELSAHLGFEYASSTSSVDAPNRAKARPTRSKVFVDKPLWVAERIAQEQ